MLLIVESNLDVIEYICSLLKSEYKIEIANNGHEGTNKAIECIPDIIICDAMMTVVDGFTMTRLLKTHELTCHIPIIMLSARIEKNEQIEGFKCGADAYLRMPFNRNELLVRMENLIKVRSNIQRHYKNLNVASETQSLLVPIEDKFMRRVRSSIDENLDNADFSVSEFCQKVNLSQPQLYRKLMALTGQSPSLFIRTIRLDKAAELLRSSDLNVSEVAWQTGFNDPSYFSRIFHKNFGVTPSHWRNNRQD